MCLCLKRVVSYFYYFVCFFGFVGVVFLFIDIGYLLWRREERLGEVEVREGGDLRRSSFIGIKKF